MNTNYALHFDDTYHQHLNCGRYWDNTMEYGKFLYEAWVNIETGAQYVISDGYGGAHNLLWGFNGAAGGYGTITGNVWINGGAVSFTSIDGIWEGDWHHIAAGWDGSYLYTWIDGVLSKKTSAAGVRKTIGDVSEGNMFVAGSTHSNYKGYIRAIAGFEGHCPVTATYRPEPNFNNAYSSAYAPIMSRSFLLDMSRPALVVPDLSDGFSNGTRQVMTNTVVAAAGITGDGNAKNVVTAAGMPNSPKTVTTAVTTALTTATSIATAMRTALAADADVGNFFIVGGTGADIKLTAIDPAVDDSTFNFTIDNDTCTGITTSATSTATTAGLLGQMVRHPGVLASELDGELYGSFPNQNVSGFQDNLPTWVVKPFTQPTTFRGTQLSIPVGAVVYDDFSRANVTWAWTEALTPGTSRTGQVWSAPNSNIGIIDGCLYTSALSSNVYAPSGAYIETGSATQDVTITRKSGSDEGIFPVLRYTDANNRIAGYIGSGYAYVYDVVAGVVTAISGFGVSIGTSWTTLRLTVSGTTVTLYVDGSSVASGTTSIASGTSAGVEFNAQTARCDTFLAV